MKTGSNDPCPCGSGLKYKKCCADKDDASEHQRVMGPVMDELKELLKGKNFGSLDEANAFLRQHNQQRNPCHKTSAGNRPKVTMVKRNIGEYPGSVSSMSPKYLSGWIRYGLRKASRSGCSVKNTNWQW